MEIWLPLDSIHDVIKTISFRDKVCLKCSKILGTSYSIPGWMFRFFSSGKMSHNLLVTHWWKQWVLKIDDSDAFKRGIQMEIWLQNEWLQVPYISSSWGIDFSGKKYHYIVQEYIPWKILDEAGFVSDEQLWELATWLWAIHSIKQWPYEGLGRLDELKNGVKKSFDEYISWITQKISTSTYFTDTERGRIENAISYQKDICARKMREPCLVHWDFHPWNILVSNKQDGGNEDYWRIIDFGDVEWSFPERDFATLRTHAWSRENLDKFMTIQQEYEKMHNLDSDMLDLMYLAVWADKFCKRSQRNNARNQALFEDLVLPLLERIEQKMSPK